MGTLITWDRNGNQLSSVAITDDPVIVNRDTLAAKAQTALNVNAAFLALASPTNPQVLAQVQALTKQFNALIRIDLGLLDSTNGT